MNWPDLVQALGMAIAAVLAAWQGVTARRVRKLEDEVRELKAHTAELTSKLRDAVRHIRDRMRWEREQKGPPPVLPDSLRDEV